MNPVRSKLLVLAQPKAPDAPRPFCKWCGEEIVFSEHANGRHRQRTRHRGDKYEARGNRRNCNREFKQSMVWRTADALRWKAVQEAREKLQADPNRPVQYEIHCEECGDLCETGKDTVSPRHGFGVRAQTVFKRWEGDHIHELVDGGRHYLGNLQALCVSCHVVKTTKERTRRILEKAKKEIEKVWDL